MERKGFHSAAARCAPHRICLAGRGQAASRQLADVALPRAQLAVPEARASIGGGVFVTSDDDGSSSEEFEELRNLVIWCVI